MSERYSNIVDVPNGTPLTGDVSAAEEQARIDLALCHRILHWFGLTDLTHTHISARVPGEDRHFLQLPYGHLFAEARASDMVKCTIDGTILTDPTGLGISRGGFAIHAAIHRQTPDAHVIIHAHSVATIAVASQQGGLQTFSQHAMRFHRRIAYLDYCGFFDSEAKYRALPDALGTAQVLMLRNHGPLVVGRTPWEAFSRLYYLEKACEMQIAMQSAGAALVAPAEADVAAMALAFDDPGQREALREWEALKRLMTRQDPCFAD